MGRRFKGPAKQVQASDIPSDEDDNQEEDDWSIKAEGESNLGSGKIPEKKTILMSNIVPLMTDTNSGKIV